MQNLIKFNAKLSSCGTLDEVRELFIQYIEHLGFYAFSLGSAPLRKGRIDSSGVEIYSTLPLPFQDDYRKQQLERVDPVFEIMASRFVPFTKASIKHLVESAPHKAAVNELADDHDIGEALMIPINTADCSRGAVLLTKMPPDDFEQCLERNGPLLHMATLAVMQRAVQFGFGKASKPEVQLTERERECLELCAQGKTYDVIAQTLSITERTVRFHLSNSYEKLDARGSSHAVTRALQLGLIRI